jgi:uncharacterized repeat protein (TIGR01451 family)
MPLYTRKLVVFLLISVAFSTHSVGQSYHTISFTFSLAQPARTTAGVFTKEGVLLRTLWSGVSYAAGSFTRSWDGLDDQGLLVADGSYDIKVLSNNITYTWEGVIGNTSFGISQNNAVQRGFLRTHAMAITGNTAYYGNGYAEGNPSQAKFTLDKPQARIEFFPKGETAQATWFVATDGNTVYWAGYDGYGNGNTWFIFGTNTSDDKEKAFSQGAPLRMSLGKTYNSCFDVINDGNGTISGLAVQKTGNFLFVSHKTLRQIRVYDKTTGALVQTLSVNEPGGLAVDAQDNLWLVDGTSARKHTVQSNGTLSAASLTVSGLTKPMAIAVSPDNNTVVVADGGASQQLKAFSNQTGATSWTMGQAGGYSTDPNVTNDKFYFSDVSGGINNTFLAFSPDGSFWVGDSGNYRVQHYSASRSFIDRIQYMQNNYSCFVDQNNPNRVFAQFLEFAVDYSKPLASSWTLVKNWRAAMPASYFELNNINNAFITNIFSDVLTMSNGRTYAFMRRFTDNKWVVVELPATGQVRETSVAFDAQNRYTYHITKDGALKQSANNINGTQGTVDWQTRPLTGFDGNNNPVWGNAVDYASAPIASGGEPIDWYGGQPRTGETTASNVMITFDAGKVRGTVGGGFHLGGIRANDKKWLWKTAPATTPAYTGSYPTDGAYDVGNDVEYGGGGISVYDRHIFWNYHGEFWKNSQVNKWQHVYDNGLLLGVFGKTGPEAVAESVDKGPVPGMAGNVFLGNVVKASNGNVYLYHGEEWGWSGVHRWRIDGLNTIQETVVPVTLATAATHGLMARYMDGTDLNNLNVKTSRVDAIVDFSWKNKVPTGTAVTSATAFSVKWVGFVQPTYSQTYKFFTTVDKGVRLWVNGKLLVDRWTNASLTEYGDTIRLVANQRYAIRLESQGGTRVALAWSSSSQAKQTINTNSLYPDSGPDATQGTDLLDGLLGSSVLADNLYGWRRSPVAEDYTDRESKYWTARTSIKTYGQLRTPDLYVHFRQNTGAYTVSRDLSAATTQLDSWKMTGRVNQEGAFFNIDEGPTRNGGSAIEVIDNNGKVLTQLYAQVYFNQPNAPAYLYANNKVIAQGEYFNVMWPAVGKSQPLDISMVNGVATIKFGSFDPVQVNVLDPLANWRRPKTLRLRFWGNGYNMARVIDIEEMRFFSTSTTTTNAPRALTDLVLSLESDKLAVRTGEAVTFRLRLKNNELVAASDNVAAQWSCRLPPNLELVSTNNLTFADGVLTGSVANLRALTDTLFTFTAKPLVAGSYKMAAQITAGPPDPDSTPDSGTDDGEDDAGMVVFRTAESSRDMFVSPNPNQLELPLVQPDAPRLDSSKVDLSLTMTLDKYTPKVNDVVSCYLTVGNAGLLSASGIQLSNQLPAGLEFVSGTGWTVNGGLLSYTIASLPAGATTRVEFKLKVTKSGNFTNLAQIAGAQPTDSDSTPGNGFANGEDDEAQVSLRTVEM